MPAGSEAADRSRGEPEPRPFLKWAGGKSQLLEQFATLLPRPGSYRRYLEPFVGSGALFFHLRPDEAELADVNREIVDCYRAVKARPGDVIRELEKHRHDERHYYDVRANVPPKLAERAARTIYLNKTGYNGLYRVNASGRFNVPMGRYANPGFQSPTLFATIRACSRALASARLAAGDFATSLEGAGREDFVYLDPPYVPVSDTADFTSYARGGFGWADQERLAAVCRKLWRRGARVMLSNSDTESVRALYRGFRVDVVHASRSINSRGAKRGKVREVVVRNFDDDALLPLGPG
ncbi:MAG TPA: DNA adenine methylase [Polyangiaceae bacterium]|jgi:DNA adenine methylase|nr:DNA adenine methylase [Polyangiaceae bacterium]